MKSVKKTDDGYKLSLYPVHPMTEERIIKIALKIASAFPQLPETFYSLLHQRAEDNGFSDERFEDAVNYIIDTCQYPQPKIADFIQFDKNIDLYTHREMLDATYQHGKYIWEIYRPLVINGENSMLYAHIDDIKKHNLLYIKNNSL